MGLPSGMEYKVEIRSVNHKGLDIGVRMPSLLMQYEIEIRNRIRETFQRGKIDVLITVNRTASAKGIGQQPAGKKKMHEAFSQVQQELALPERSVLSFLPDIATCCFSRSLLPTGMSFSAYWRMRLPACV